MGQLGCRPAEHGVALITAILIVALATIIAVSMATQLKIDVRRVANLLGHDQAWHIALGGEAWAQGILRRDAAEGKVDSLDELWATQLPPFPVEGGTAEGKIEDLQGRFNLNSLVRNSKHDVVFLEIFSRLLERLDVDPNLAVAVADWIDPDSDIGGTSGAENETYSSMDPSYRAANRPMETTSELNLIHGFDADIVRKISPYVTALPEPTWINVNTASTLVLTALAPSITLAEAEEIDVVRREKPFESIAAFKSQPNLTGAAKGLAVLTEKELGVSSGYFLVEAKARVGRGRVTLLSLLYRKQDRVTVLRRSYGAW